ncbi:alpha/beta hydrolase [Mucilaginibacter lappiensis]|uniref:Acetyl esterase/lipase n=1 Tax=Mucilaginibacter lappiensis TaxID=354630 RepID=A0A1N6YKB4_9SPHI|nr:alpha/beta hydrolase fold domain-containing protein [Mucilaginibacter lappiensis]MBB6109771.1 acetyl esterase/lipase [Mucilaginibacter lappiensis]MBB6130991.1 acetyl esterase/lipase [Mucilaginibacter lappiensis]SIR14976.1 Acetyl esterase/lipase [Mucilaginibacter lappiensis]
METGRKQMIKAGVSLLLMLWVIKLSAQQNNFSENYSGYLTETSNYYKNQPAAPRIELTPAIIKAFRQVIDKQPRHTLLTPSVEEIDGPNGKIGLRIFRPEKINAVYLDIHGGGNIYASARFGDSINDVMARKCNIAIVSVDYHLAPEFPYPAQILDCNTAAKWLLKNARVKFGTEKIFVGGGSAGAQNAAATIIYIRDSLKSADKILGVGLQYGIFDLSKTPSHRLITEKTPVLNKYTLEEMMKAAYGQFSIAQLQNPQLSPLYADLRNLPPAFFMCGMADAFIDDTNFMESRWRMAGNKTYLALFPEAAHGFNLEPIKIAEVANNLYFEWIKNLIANSK